MEESHGNKKLYIIAAALLLLLLLLLGYYVTLDGSGSSSERRGSTSDRISQSEDDSSAWYVGYLNRLTQELYYSEVFESQRDCLAYEERIRNTSSLDVVIDCFGIPDETEGPVGIDIFTQDEYIAQQLASGNNVDTFVRDEIPPTITLKGDNPVIVAVNDTYSDAGATATDDRDGDITDKISTNGLPVVTFLPSKTTITYRVTDRAGNIAYATREVQITRDAPAQNTPPQIPRPTNPNPNQLPPSISLDATPIIVLKGYNPMEVEVGAAYYDLGAAAYDVEDGDMTRFVEVSGLPIDTYVEGDHYITYSVTDRAGNVAQTTRIVEVAQPFVDMRSDMSYMESCYGKMARGLCEVADINGNGAVGSNDTKLMIDRLLPFEVTGDPAISLELEGEITSCFMKLDGKCAMDTEGDLTVTRSYLSDTAYGALLASTASGNEYGIDLGAFKNRLGSSLLDRITYETIAQYDFNRDGIADLSGWVGGTGENNSDKQLFDSCITKDAVGGCAVADVNGDGKVLSWDLIMFTAMQSNLLPDTFTISEFDMSMFDRTLYTDALVVHYCNENNLYQGSCELADFDGDGDVDDADENAFLTTTPRYDLNDDGRIDGVSISFSF